MDREYWGDNVNPEEDDYDLWIDPDKEEPETECSEEEAEDLETAMEELEGIIEEIGPPAVLEAVSQYLFTLPRPFHRVAKTARDLAERAQRAAGAVEEARQTRGYDR